MKQLHNVLGILFLVSFSSCAATIKNARTESFKVAGKCEMCKSAIETAASKKGVADAEWDVDTKMLKLTFDPEKTSSVEVLKRIAYAGYDNEMFLAPEEAYAKLPGCCKYDRMKATAVESAASDNELPKDTVKELQVSNALTEVYNQYFLLKDALVRDNATVAATKAEALTKSISGVAEKSMTTEENALWKKTQTDLLLHAKHISESKDIAHQREHFALLSQNMITLAKVFKADDAMYIQHCPMYNDGEGADWLSKENAVKNPYYGSSMLTCGKTTTTIK